MLVLVAGRARLVGVARRGTPGGRRQEPVLLRCSRRPTGTGPPELARHELVRGDVRDAGWLDRLLPGVTPYRIRGDGRHRPSPI